jgi:hypothetical protein
MLKVIDKDGDPVSTDTLTFTSSMPAVATVRSNGLVDGVSTGNTTITVTSIYGNAKAYVIVNVRDLKVVSSSNTITAGMPIPLQMRAVLIPGEEPLDSLITWTAMDAEDDSTDGITITSDSSHGAYGYLTTTRTEAGKVDVIASSTYRLEAKKDPPVDIVGTETPVVVIEAGTGWNPLAAVGDTFTLTAERSGTSDPVMWSSNNTSVATVSDGVIDVVGVGDAIITASAGTAKAEFEVNARGLVIGPEDAELKLSLLGTLLSGLLGSDPLQLYVTMTGGTSDIPVSTVVWEIANIDALTLLSTPKIDKHSGVLSMEAGLLNITGLLAIGSVDVKASLPGTNITATKSIDIVSLL